TATVVDGDGNTSTAFATEAVTVNPQKATVTWGTATPGTERKSVVEGKRGEAGEGRSGEKKSPQKQGGERSREHGTLRDGTGVGGHSFTAAPGNTQVDVKGWTL